MLEASRNLLLTALVIVVATVVYREYNVDSCGTARVCGIFFHDALHAIF